MKILSYNIRSLGGRLKKKELRELITRFSPDMVCLQETKVCDHNLLNGSVLWGKIDFKWKARNSNGRAGGIWISWRTDKFKLSNFWSVEGVVGVEGEWVESGKNCVVANIYSPCDSRGKMELWRNISQKINSSSYDIWCLIGDFNEVRNARERKGNPTSQNSVTMKKFEELI